MRFCCLNIHMSRTCHGVVAIVVPICKSAQHVIRSKGATKLLVWRGLRMADEGEGPPSSQAWIFPGLTGLIPMATPWSSIIQHSERLQRWTASPPPRPSTSCGNQQVTSSASVAERMLASPFTAELCGHVLARAHARTGDAAMRRCGDDLRLHRQRGRVRYRDRDICNGLRRQGRARSCGTCGRRQDR
jgi:hypothetical protein